MTKELLPEPDPAVLTLLNGSELSGKIGTTIQIVTVDPSLKPRIALLSVGEILAVSATEWRLALHEGSDTSQNLGSPGRTAIVSVIVDGAHFVHELTVREIQIHNARISGRRLAVVSAAVAASWKDSVDYATLSNGITYQLLAPESAVIERWTETINLLATFDGSQQQP